MEKLKNLKTKQLDTKPQCQILQIKRQESNPFKLEINLSRGEDAVLHFDIRLFKLKS